MNWVNWITGYFYSSEIEKQCTPPISSAFFPSTLLKWDPDTDYDVPFNIVREPLAKRESLYSQKLLAGFNQKTSDQLSQGVDSFNEYNFTFWQYIDIYCYFAGSASEGIIVPPTPYWIRTAHKNGVKIYGTIFFPPVCFGGKIEWVEQTVDGNECADKLVELTKVYGFDGWFVNQETYGGNPQLSEKIQQFLIYIRSKGVEIMWYDAMVWNGDIDYQNELDKEDAPFFETLMGLDFVKVSDSIFLNFGWDTKMLISSGATAIKLKRSPFDVFAGIDVSMTQLETNKQIQQTYNKGNPLVSVGLFACQWPVGVINSGGLPKNYFDRQYELWKNISTCRTEPCLINNLPFLTRFNTGRGMGYWLDGKSVSNQEWTDISQQDLLPTWRFHDKLDVNFNYNIAHKGGSSLQISGSLNEQIVEIPLFKTSLQSEEKTCLKVTYFYEEKEEMQALIILYFSSGIERMYPLCSIEVGKWYSVDYPLPRKETVTKISVLVTATSIGKISLSLGELGIVYDRREVPAKPSNLMIKAQSEESINLAWDYDPSVWYWNIYQESEFLARASTNIYHLSKVDPNKRLRVEPVSRQGKKGESAYIG